MSMLGTPGIYRLASPATASIAMNASNNANVTFNTNIPSLDYALRIRRCRWFINCPTTPRFNQNSGGNVQVFAQLTENQTKTAVLPTDTSFLDEAVVEWQADYQQATAASISDVVTRFNFWMDAHYFYPEETPYTVATKLNVICSIANQNGMSGSGTVTAFVQMEYTLERLTADLRDYLAKRLQIQGS